MAQNHTVAFLEWNLWLWIAFIKINPFMLWNLVLEIQPHRALKPFQGKHLSRAFCRSSASFPVALCLCWWAWLAFSSDIIACIGFKGLRASMTSSSEPPPEPSSSPLSPLPMASASSIAFLPVEASAISEAIIACLPMSSASAPTHCYNSNILFLRGATECR